MKSISFEKMVTIEGGGKQSCEYTMGLITGIGVGACCSGAFLPLGIVMLATAGGLAAMGACGD